MSETMENAALNSGEIADRTPAAKAEETKADKFIRQNVQCRYTETAHFLYSIIKKRK